MCNGGVERSKGRPFFFGPGDNIPLLPPSSIIAGRSVIDPKFSPLHFRPSSSLPPPFFPKPERARDYRALPPSLLPHTHREKIFPLFFPKIFPFLAQRRGGGRSCLRAQFIFYPPPLDSGAKGPVFGQVQEEKGEKKKKGKSEEESS